LLEKIGPLLERGGGLVLLLTINKKKKGPTPPKGGVGPKIILPKEESISLCFSTRRAEPFC